MAPSAAFKETARLTRHYDTLAVQEPNADKRYTSSDEAIPSSGISHLALDDVEQASRRTVQSAGRPIVRRKRRQPPPHPAASMSLVGLKNFFFKKTVTPLPRKSHSDDSLRSIRSFTGPTWAAESGQPLLPNPAFEPRTPTPNSRSYDADVESQSGDSTAGSTYKRSSNKIDPRIISDATIGLSDGLTVPFALTAGLSALGNTRVVVYGGFAELIAGAISMGLGGYLGAKSEAASYKALKEETQDLIANDPQAALQMVADVFEPYGLPQHTVDGLTRHLANSPALVDFIMRFVHCAEEPATARAFISCLTIAAAYFLGGLLPLIPYIFVGRTQVYLGLYISIGVMVIALFLFGYGKTCAVVGWKGGRNVRRGCFGGIQMVLVGSAAAGSAMGLVRLFNGDEGGIKSA